SWGRTSGFGWRKLRLTANAHLIRGGSHGLSEPLVSMSWPLIPQHYGEF
ncbi:hypothetical protein M91_19552, partial [Bos mutus]